MNQLLVIDGVSVRQDNSGRYCLNDLHRAAGGEERHKPANFFRQDNIKTLCAEIDRCSDLSIGCVESIRGGPNQGTYVSKELVYAYAMWISAIFNLKVIRTFDAVMTGQHNIQRSDQVQAGVILLESAARTLNFSNSSKLGAYQKLQEFAGLPNMMPSYAIDAPSDSVDGSSRPTMALTTLLQRHNLGLSTNEAFNRLKHAGIVERRSRPSTSPKARNGQKQFWSVTSRGMLFGKNITSPGNPRETQPHFFETKVQELIRIIVSSSAA
ncbi:KilA-N domain-containing protein [Erwinia sp. AnSW2-5]|uniref:KilA-N domain-containing protein n=1 Tax=Erwinia sp. AnSW2-5 TaxID=3367692 RepID=UPI00385E8EED